MMGQQVVYCSLVYIEYQNQQYYVVLFMEKLLTSQLKIDNLISQNSSNTNIVENIPLRKASRQDKAELVSNNTNIVEEINTMQTSIPLAGSQQLLRGKICSSLNEVGLSQVINYKTSFLASISHELKTPLNSATIFIHILKSCCDFSEQIHDTIIFPAYCSIEILNSVVSDIVDLGQLEIGEYQLDISQFNISELVQQILLLFIPQSIQKKIDISSYIEEDLKQMLIYSDMQRIKQILINLIANSFKFTARGKIVVSVTKSEENPEQIDISVEDTGCGMTQQAIQQISGSFEDFQNYGPFRSNSNQRGLGIGLDYCQKITKKLNTEGKGIEINSEIGKGTTIKFFASNHTKSGIHCFKRKVQIFSEQFMEDWILQIQDDNIVGSSQKSSSVSKEQTNSIVSKTGKESKASSGHYKVQSQINKQRLQKYQTNLSSFNHNGDSQQDLYNAAKINSKRYSLKNKNGNSHSVHGSVTEFSPDIYVSKSDVINAENNSNYLSIGIKNSQDQFICEYNIDDSEKPSIEEIKVINVFQPRMDEYEFNQYESQAAFNNQNDNMSIQQKQKHIIKSIKQHNTKNLTKGFTNLYSLKENECSCSKILLIDDDIFNINAVSMIMQSRYDKVCNTACNGKLGLDIVKSRLEQKCQCCNSVLNLIIMDIDMPIMNGFESAQGIYELYKKHNIIDELPIICCHTAFKNENKIQQFLSKGIFKATLNKPFSIQEIDKLISQAFRK